MAEVVVPFSDARDGSFPPVCAMSGTPADGAIPLTIDRSLLRWRSATVRIPLSKAAFRRWSIAQSVMVKVRIVSIVLVVVSLVLSAKNPLLALLFLIAAGVAMAISVRAERKLAGLQPSVERTGSSVRLSGVHDEFATAVRVGHESGG